MQSKSVSVFWLKGILHSAERAGVKLADILQTADIAELPKAANERVPLDDTVKLWDAAIKLSRDPMFGFNMGRQFRPNWFHLIHHLWVNSPDVRTAITQTIKYQTLISDGGDIDCIEDHDSLILSYRVNEASLPFSHHQTDAVLAIIVSLMRMSVSEEFTPTRIHISHNHREHHARYQAYFQCPIDYGQHCNQVIFPKQWLEQPLIGADPDLLQLHQQLANQNLSTLNKKTWSKKVAQILIIQGQYNSHTKIQMAKCLNTSSRTLQRRLKEEETSYFEVCDLTRKSLADQLIKQNIPTGDMVESLAFSETSSLHKAIKRWFGQRLIDIR